MPCDRCHGNGWVDAASVGMTVCACVLDRYVVSQVGERFAKASFDALVDDVVARGKTPHASLLYALDRVRAKPTASYFLYGDHGAWKTYLAASQFRALVTGRTEDLARVRFYTEPDLAKMFRDAEMERPTTSLPISADDVHGRRIDHVFIDDLGKRRVTDFIRDQYFDLINAIHRMQRVGLTITSNASIRSLAYDENGNEVYDPGMARRIQDLCEPLEIRIA